MHLPVVKHTHVILSVLFAPVLVDRSVTSRASLVVHYLLGDTKMEETAEMGGCLDVCTNVAKVKASTHYNIYIYIYICDVTIRGCCGNTMASSCTP